MLKLVPVALAALLCAPTTSCILAVGAGAGYLVSQEVLPNDVLQAQVQLDVDTVWSQAQATLRDMKVGDFETTDFPRRIETTVDRCDVEVVVEAYDLNRTILKVRAERFTTSREETARKILNRILDDLGVDY